MGAEPFPSIAPAQSPQPGTEQALGKHSVDGRQGCGLNTAEGWISVSVISCTRASGLVSGFPWPPTLTARPRAAAHLCVPGLCLCSSWGHVSRRRVLGKLIPKRQTAAPSADQMGPATPTVALQHPTDTLRWSGPFSLFLTVGTALPRSLTGEEGTTLQSNWPR